MTPLDVVVDPKSVSPLATGEPVPKRENPLASEPKQPGRAALVKELADWVKDEKRFWKPIFDRIREEQSFAAGKQWPEDYKVQSDTNEPYVGDLIQQMVNRKTATLYARNPTPESKVRERLSFEVWDETQESLNGARAILQAAQPMLAQAAQAMAAGMIPRQAPPPEIEMAQSIVMDYERGMAEKALLHRIAKTGELLIGQQWDKQTPDFMVSMKQLVTRVLTSRVGYIKVMYQRDLQAIPTETANAMGISEKLATLKARLAEIEEDAREGEDEAKQEELRLLLQSMLAQAAQPTAAVSEEGVVLDFLSATSVIVDRRCRCLRDFIGARRVCHEILMSVEDAEAKFGIELDDSGAVRYAEDGKESLDYRPAIREGEATSRREMVCVWHVEDKDTGLAYLLIDGMKDFVREPEANSPQVNRFWSIVPLAFNCQEVEVNLPHEDVTCYPRSDVRLAMPMQKDINIAGEGLREHRCANRPWWVAIGSRWMDDDLRKLSNPRAAHTVLRLQSMNSGEKIGDFIQPGPMQPIDWRVYDPAPSGQAMMLATGQQASDLGQQRPNERATGQQIAAQQKAATDLSNMADIDFCLSTVAQMMFEMLMAEMPEAMVKKLVGRGAVWPSLAKEDVAERIFMRIEAGSSGRPDQMQELDNFQVIGPQLAQLMTQSGRSMEPLIKEGVRRLGDKLDVDDFLKPAQVQMPTQPPAMPGAEGARPGQLPNIPPTAPGTPQNPAGPPVHGGLALPATP